MKKIKLPTPSPDCYICHEFTLGEFTEEQIKICAEHWMNAKNCPNFKPVEVIKELNNKNIKVIWV